MKDVIDLLLEKQATLEADREAEKALAIEKIEAEYADRETKINALLDMAGYVKPTEEEVAEDLTDATSVEVAETAPEIVDTPVSAQCTIY